MPPAVAVAAPPAEVGVPTARRFTMPDLSQHGGWIMERLKRQYPQKADMLLAGWLRSHVDSPESMFLYRPRAVALAVMEHMHTLDGAPVVRERFVWAKDPGDKQAVAEAAAFYDDLKRWAVNVGAGIMLVEEASDVPHEVIREKFGRVFTREQKFVRL